MDSAFTVSACSAVLRVLPSPLGANGLPSVPVDEVESHLEVNAALFEHGGNRVLLLTLDLLFVGPEITRRVREVVRQRDPSTSVWISASHTHRAPAVDAGKPGLGVAPASTVSAIADQICGLVERILAQAGSGKSVRPRVGQADMLGLSVHRRSPGRIRLTNSGLRTGGIVAAASFVEPVQRYATRVDWIDDAGEVVLMMWHWACHPTAYPDPHSISADYVGVVRDCLRKEAGNVPVLFFQGFAGDVRPPAIRTLRTNPVRRVLLGAGFRRFTTGEYRTWCQDAGNRIASISTEETPLDERPLACLQKRVEFNAAQFVNGGNTRTVVQQSVQLGLLNLHGVSAEPSYGHVPRGVDEKFTWYCGYLEDVYGYLPTESQHSEGGYEVDGFCAPFGCESLNLEGIRTMEALFIERARDDVSPKSTQ